MRDDSGLSWEQRMSNAAGKRERARQDAQTRAAGRIYAEQMRATELLYLDLFKEGPPDECRECYMWLTAGPWGQPCWWHGKTALPGPPLAGGEPEDWCYHSCHRDGPMFCGPIAFASSGGSNL